MSAATATVDLSKLRDDFPILAQQIRGKPLVYLDNAATTQRPRQVIQSMVEMYEKHYANVHRGIHWLSDQSTDLYEEARDKVRTFIGAAQREEVIFTTGTTSAINLVARSWGDKFVSSGDEIIVTEMEHHANLVPWHQLAERTGCRVKAIPIDDQGALALDQLDGLLGPRTKLVTLTAVSNVLGTINPVAEIVAKAHTHGALVLVDAAQAVPHAVVNVNEWNADFVAFSGHKMMGPSGVGVLYGKRQHLEAMPPFQGGGSMIRRVRVDSFEPAELPEKFEAGTPPIVAAVGLGAAIDYVQTIGLESVANHAHALCQRAHEMLNELGNVTILGPSPDETAGIVSFVVQGVHAHDVAQILDSEGVAIRAGHHCAMPLHQRLGVNASCRASFYCYNTLAELDVLASGLRRACKVFRRETTK